MKQTKHTVLAFLLTLCLTLGLLPALTPTANAAGVSYKNANGVMQTTTETVNSVGSNNTYWNTGWYQVSSAVPIKERVTVTGDVHLILCDGMTLTAEKGITVSEGNSLTIYGQTTGTGKLNATNPDSNYAGIGGYRLDTTNT